MHDMPPGPQPTFPLFDRLLEGTLTKRLVDWQGDDLSSEEMAFRLRELGCVVSAGTVRRWLQQIEAAS